MSDRFTLSGGYTTTPLGGEPSFDPNIDAPIDETVQLVKKKFDTIELTVDTPVVVDFGGLTNANVIILKSTGGVKVSARVTSADGTTQAVPFDTYFVLMSMDVPITAIDLTRTPATPTTVRVFLGEEG
ncbi:MAG: hypothetical protein V3W28_01525 [Thermoplasmata archaeon]